jgi:hypothetical protein
LNSSYKKGENLFNKIKKSWRKEKRKGGQLFSSTLLRRKVDNPLSTAIALKMI